MNMPLVWIAARDFQKITADRNTPRWPARAREPRNTARRRGRAARVVRQNMERQVDRVDRRLTLPRLTQRRLPVMLRLRMLPLPAMLPRLVALVERPPAMPRPLVMPRRLVIVEPPPGTPRHRLMRRAEEADTRNRAMVAGAKASTSKIRSRPALVPTTKEKPLRYRRGLATIMKRSDFTGVLFPA
jgi:hypothetical protein